MVKNKTNINIIIADNSPEFLEGLQILLSSVDVYYIIDIALNGKELTESKLLNKADILLIDIDMPEMNGIQAATIINNSFPDLPMVAITMHQDDVYLNDVIAAGYKGFIYKPHIAENIFNVIENVLQGKMVFPDDLKLT